LEREKLLLTEKQANSAHPRRSFEEMFELALGFLASPSNLWRKGEFVQRRLVLKLTFAQNLCYCRKEGFLNPKMSLPLKLLEGIQTNDNKMADREVVLQVGNSRSLPHLSATFGSGDSID
jgi:hypothetical protein